MHLSTYAIKIVTGISTCGQWHGEHISNAKGTVSKAMTVLLWNSSIVAAASCCD